jgi:3-oxoadipate enol-lactonase
VKADLSPTPGEPVRRKDSTEIAVKQVTPEHARTCERWFDPELKPHLDGASMQVTVNDIDTRYVLGVKVFTTPQMKPHSDKCAVNVRQIGTASIVDESVRSLLTETYRKARPEVVKHVDEMVARTSAQGFASVAEAIHDVAPRRQSTSIKTPALVVAGRHDADMQPMRSKEVVDSLMDARFEILDAAHLSPAEETQRFAAFLETFLRENV